MRLSELFFVVLGFTVGPLALFRASAVRDFLVAKSEGHPAGASRLAEVIGPAPATRFQRAAFGWAEKGWYITSIRVCGAVWVIQGLISLGKVVVRILT